MKVIVVQKNLAKHVDAGWTTKRIVTYFYCNIFLLSCSIVYDSDTNVINNVWNLEKLWRSYP